MNNNLFHTGEVKINLNDGKPVIREHEFLFEPGMTVRKNFFIENDSTWDVYYRLDLDNISGGLAEVLTVTGKDGLTNTVLVEPGRIRVERADCPDQICVHQGDISDGSQPIVCLPNRLIIQIQGGGDALDAAAG